MPGRFVIATKMQEIEETFSVRSTANSLINYRPNYNVAPGQNIPVIINKSVELLRWGLVPKWAKDQKIGYKLINARAENIEERPSYKDSFHSKRCLIVANGFFEWINKKPIYITIRDRETFAMAGIYDEWHSKEKDEKEENIIKSCSLITTSPNKFISNIHDRMPVIIPKGRESDYLMNFEIAKSLLRPSSEELRSWSVTDRCNSTRYNTKECIVPTLDNREAASP